VGTGSGAESVKSLADQEDRDWLAGARGKAVKVISHLLQKLPDHHAYRVIFMHRSIQEVIRSQNKMLVRRGEQLGDDQNVATLFEQHLRFIQRWLKEQQNISVLDLRYSEVITDPLQGSARVVRFLKTDLDQEKMAAAVDPSLYRNRVRSPG
jgi:hypothetical protein